jgi:hypothetical protein
MDERDDADKAKDDELCRQFLADSFLVLSAQEEREARAALARRIRDQMPVSITRELLALAVDPDAAPSIPGMVPTRKFLFENAAKGQPSEWRRHSHIRYLMKKQYLPEVAAKALTSARKERARIIRRYKAEGREPPLSEQRRLDKMIENARTGRGLLEAMYVRAEEVHRISRSTAQRIWRGK